MKKFLALLLVALMALALVACQKPDNPTPADPTAAPAETEANNETEAPADTEAPAETEEPTPEPTEFVRPTEYVRAADEDIYYEVLEEYVNLMDYAKQAANPDESFVRYAKAEAYLLSTGVMIPTTTQGGAYQISRIAYRTIPYANWGNDDDRWHSIVISDEFISVEERAELIEMWNKAAAGEGTYDPAAYLEGKGHTIQTDYTTTFSTAPVTIDWLNTSSQSDTEITVNTVDGLVEYDNLGNMQPRLAESWDISEDGLTYTFHIRQGVKWFTSEGKEYADVTAKDFEAGFHHMLDAKAGLEWLVEGVIVGVSEYLEGGTWEEVGYKAVDDYTLEVNLCEPRTYFMTMLTYSCFLPICESFYLSRGGVFGIDEYAEAFADTNKYTFGKESDVASQVYCGPFLLTKLQKESEILVVKNPNYYLADTVTINSIKWVYDDGSNPTAFYEDVCKGVYAGCSLGASTGLLDLAKEDGNFDKYGYISDTTSTTYFGGLNINRGTFALESGAVASPKTEDQKIDTHIALMNQNFRLAMQYAFDKATYNAVSRGEDLKLASLRNMYTQPAFVKLENDYTDDDGHTFAGQTFYGDLVQYYVTEVYNMPISVADGENGWYRPDDAKACLEAAKEQLGDAVTWPIHIDVVYYSGSDSNINQNQAYKTVIEATLGTENVIVDLVESTTTDDYYASGYRAANGEQGNYDMFYGSGWGPDYGDPSTYLDTFLENGYMVKVIGLNN